MWSFLIGLALGIIKWLFSPVMPRVLDGAGPGELEERLRDRLEEEGW